MVRTKPQSPPLLITKDRDLRSLVSRLKKCPRVGLDTESASFHRYVDRVYLVQVSSVDETALIDPLALDSLKGIGELLQSNRVEVVLHDADYDLRTLNRDYGFTARKIFDTKVAAEILGEESVGLGALLKKYFGVDVDKRFQRADWSKRPLTSEMIAYAASDTGYLLRLRDKLAELLDRAGRLEWAREEFRRLEELRWSDPERSDQGFLRIKGARALSRRQLAILKQLYSFRERKAKRLDRAPFRVLANSALLDLARKAPTDTAGLVEINGISRNLANRYGAELLKAIERGLQTPEDRLPRIRTTRRARPDPKVDQAMGRLKKLRNDVAERTGIPAGLLCPNGVLQEIAKAEPRTAKDLAAIPDFRKWQAGVLGVEDVLKVVNDRQ